MKDELFIYKYTIEGLEDEEQCARVQDTMMALEGVIQVDSNLREGLIRIVSKKTYEFKELCDRVASCRCTLVECLVDKKRGRMTLAISGTTCRSCEVVIERTFKRVPGVKEVSVDATKGTAEIVYEEQQPDSMLFQRALDGTKYTLRDARGPHYTDGTKRPSVMQLIGLFSLVLLLGTVLSRLGLFKQSLTLGDSVSIGAAFMIGLVAASSSCVAVAGGIMLSAINSFQKRTGNLSKTGKLAPTIMFIAGRVFSYGLLGALIGLIGKSLSPSPYVVGIIAIIAALYMLIMGLDMLSLLPQWIKRRMPSMPKVFSHKLMDLEEKRGPVVPFILGAGTFFLPCGFTQALQLYALTLGNVLTSGLLLGAFALGTTPALFILGLASSSLKGKAGRFFFQFSGALVIVLGLWNIQNGFTILGYPIQKPSFSFLTFEAKATKDIPSQDPAVAYDGTEQIMNMQVGSAGYHPNQFTIRAGVPTKWVVRSDGSAGCLSVLQSPRLGIQQYINPGENTIAFIAPSEPGVYPFSCSMGMYRGSIHVIPNS